MQLETNLKKANRLQNSTCENVPREWYLREQAWENGASGNSTCGNGACGNGATENGVCENGACENGASENCACKNGASGRCGASLLRKDRLLMQQGEAQPVQLV
ncbi:hypothetical protein AMQ83_18585 [Paenibacillus riograndensis]|nr:hypothetical protein AMQ83_18585 [Paenibacillus riograndensis]